MMKMMIVLLSMSMYYTPRIQRSEEMTDVVNSSRSIYFRFAIRRIVPQTTSTSTCFQSSPLSRHSGTAATISSNMRSIISPSPHSARLFFSGWAPCQPWNALKVRR